uniref:Odorant receptor n=1 Tax=Adelphocoris lineolatus TaxID=236346 RepID=A0A2I4PH99_ADELI|nr:olfactory receptor 5 [Adelphocoris lineolatus]
MPPNQLLNTSKHEHDVYKRLDKLYYYGMRLLLLGITPHKFFGKCYFKGAILYVTVILLYILYGLGELLWAIIIPGGILERLSHAYVCSYCASYGVIWVYLMVKLETIHQNRIDFKSFNCSRLLGNTEVESILQKNINYFVKTLFAASLLAGANVTSYILGFVVELIVQYAETGTLEEICVLSCFPFPLWGQMIIAAANLVTLFMCFSIIMSMYIITGLLSLEIETQCEILTRTMAYDEVNDDFKTFVIDHIRLIKQTKWVVRLFENINNSLFFSSYVCLAMQMFSLSVIKPEGYYYLGVFSDFCVEFIVMASQCWLSSAVTNSVLSISEGVYNTPWYRKNKSNAIDVILMTQMAQRPYIQRVFLGTMKIEKETMIQVIQQSYSFYALLMILQSKK